MAISVIGSHSDEPHPGSEFLIKPRVLVRGAVVADFHHIHPTQTLPPLQNALRDFSQIPQENPRETIRAALERGEGDHHTGIIARLRKLGPNGPDHLE